jgi:hypothetical protein
MRPALKGLYALFMRAPALPDGGFTGDRAI